MFDLSVPICGASKLGMWVSSSTLTVRHVFCKQCIDTALQEDSRCPIDRKEVVTGGGYVPAIGLIRNMVDELRVYCSNRTRGCDFICQRSQLKEHLSSCLFSTDVKPESAKWEELDELKQEVNILKDQVGMLTRQVDVISHDATHDLALKLKSDVEFLLLENEAIKNDMRLLFGLIGSIKGEPEINYAKELLLVKSDIRNLQALISRHTSNKL